MTDPSTVYLDTFENPVLKALRIFGGPFAHGDFRCDPSSWNRDVATMTFYPVMWSVVAAVSLDIDGTLLVQMVLFGFTILFLHLLVFKPYLKVLDARSEAVEGSTEEAGEMEAHSAILETKYDEKVRQARRDAQEVRETLRNQGVAEQNDIVGEVREELNETLAEERSKIASHVEEARSEIEARAEELADSILKRLLPQQ